MEINVIGSKENWVNRPKLMEEDNVYFHDLPSLGSKPIELFKFFRKVKKCMILYWVVDNTTEKKLKPLPSSLLYPMIRTVVKKPGGPSIVVEDAQGQSSLSKIADISVINSQDYLDSIKAAYFLSECGHPSSIYKEKRQRERINWLRENASGKILEIGCSTGFVLEYVGGGTGLDLDDLRLEYARKKYPQCTFVSGDAAKMDFKDGEFDTVMIPDILEHVELPHAKKIVKECLRVGKKLIITVPNAGKPNYDKTLVENPEHRWFPTEKLMLEMVDPKAKISFSQELDFIYVAL